MKNARILQRSSPARTVGICKLLHWMNIEPGIRKVVQLLADLGVRPVLSCGGHALPTFTPGTAVGPYTPWVLLDCDADTARSAARRLRGLGFRPLRVVVVSRSSIGGWFTRLMLADVGCRRYKLPLLLFKNRASACAAHQCAAHHEVKR